MSSLFTSILSTGTYNLLSQFFFNKKERNMIIDPISCIVKLSLLNFYPDGTKISIHNNVISFDKPSFFQGSYRTIYGDSQNDLHNLHNPISKAIQWYSNIDNITILFMSTIDGLKKLKSNYPNRSIVSDALNSYIKLIQKGIIHKKTPIKKNYENLTDEEQNYISTLDSSVIGGNFKLNRPDKLNLNNDNKNNKKNDNNKSVDNEIHDFIKKLWTETEIKIIINLINELKETNNNNHLLHTIKTLITTKEKKLHDYIKTHTSIL